MRIGIAFAGNPEDPTARSGTPFGVLTGVRRLGVDAVGLQATPPRSVDRGVAVADALAHVMSDPKRWSPTAAKLAYSSAHLARATSVVRSSVLARRRSARGVDGVIALGTGYEIPRGLPYVVYDDMTVRQAIDMEYPVWTAMRESDRRFRLRQQARRYSEAVACCMTTSWAAESVISDYGVPPERVVVVGAGTHETVRDVVRNWNSPRFLFVGLDWNRKNGARVLEAFAQIRLLVPDATLDLVGGHPPVDRDGVTCHGRLYRDDPAHRSVLTRLYDAATCFVMPSVHEPGGVVFVEAAAVGVGSIAGNRGGSADFVGDAGRVVDPFDERQIFDAMREMCDPVTAQECGARASRRSRMFTWNQVAGRLIAALDPSIAVTETIEPLSSTMRRESPWR
ncbi:glycosyltransferase family 4 protein [Rhodococcus sp. BP-349]|uniref:glycosyltransferase family 4 protein n=1 Tax=unclassified Rhodococcus (in: high G+C Gram-positive bacteria) TaxID=192944 RepID=UPI001C9AEE92|nr:MULTISPECIES: glycosyltransferase family 4 protein [unclassified Rhodococcus (in: high G+C Gram-positive bacteria)]MBY6539465.1 glycosyltransferase family 4 protein [Rhodococcus sp. BP-363]MBY6544207.1 glycosyltransferase family 4 protein [Rhodococcus sp. BP-369]MBY6563437.1 glycosyltransferase family 4 protein [Rhodococcus sp. BP-370]MBY6577729.1 glycosyltransferase family 4 protein [Rhodococcus sp. BP-364]MBY6587030.1 glycosyltransferase family 4 protein [Rhodococcus sp. BP-358]